MPFCKTGGLGDVAGALSQELARAGHEVWLFLPLYKGVSAPGLGEAKALALSVPFGGAAVKAALRVVPWGEARAAFVDCPAFFDRDGLYGLGGADHADNAARFAFFSRAVLEGAKAAGLRPDVIHAHDWQTGLVCAHLRRHYAADPVLARAASLFTIHNMAYQGLFPPEAAGAAGFGPEDLTPEGLEYYGKVSYLKAGLVFADILNTVSPGYAREIQESSERGFGFEGLLRRRSADLHGVLNGLDLAAWDPRQDRHLARGYGPADAAEGKAACKRALLEETGLALVPRVPLVGIVSRLDRQKGLDLALEALAPRLARLSVAVLGSGDPALRAAFEAFAAAHPDRACFRMVFDEPFAHRLYAASDLFLMPSRFEPCGLGQMIAMRYGSVPVAARTGGLADTVLEGTRGNGFLAESGDAADLGRALDRALAAYASPAWPGLVARGMASDFSWDRSVAEYLRLYELARKRRPVGV